MADNNPIATTHNFRRKHQKKKQSKLNTNRDDLISCLPDDILCRIIDLLPFESAVKSSLLSTRWNNLWKKALLMLSVDDIDHANINGVKLDLNSFPPLYATMEEALVPTILEFLKDFPRPRYKWGSQLDFGHGKFLLFAIAPNNILHLDFSSAESGASPLMVSDWLLELPYKEWQEWEIECDLLSCVDSCISNFKLPDALKLQSLNLTSVSCLSCETVSSIVSNLRHLRNLTTAKCHGVRSLDLRQVKLHKLLVLDCARLESISCSRRDCLTSFGYRGKLIPFEFEVRKPLFQDGWWDILLLCGVKWFVDAMLYSRRGPGYEWNNTRGKLGLEEELERVKSLTLSRWVFEEFKYGFPLNNLKELWWIDSSSEKESVNALLCCLECCPRLKRLYITMDPKGFHVASRKRVPDKVVGLENLKLLKLEGFPNEYEEINLVKQLRPFFKRKPLIVAKPSHLELVCRGDFLRFLSWEKMENVLTTTWLKR